MEVRVIFFHIMHKKTLEDLAFYRIREEIAGNCASEEGKAELLRRAGR